MFQNTTGGWERIKEFFQQLWLGIRNVHFFRMSTFPRLIRALSKTEKRLLVISLLALILGSAFLIEQTYYNGTKLAPGYGGRYTEGIVGQPRYINPALSATNAADRDLTRVVFSGLLKFDADQKLVPDLAESLPEISADQKQYTLKLRQNVTWHDGQRFTADDVIFTVHLIQNQAFQSPVRLNWNKVEIQKTDDYTVVISLKEPFAPFVANLTQGILPKHIWENIDAKNFTLAKYNLQAIGTGPFQVKDIKKSDNGEVQSVRLTAFKNYYFGRPYLDELEFKFYTNYDELIAAYHSKDILGLGYVPFDKKLYVEKSSRINLYYLNLPQYQALFLNRGKSQVLSDKNVRAALAESLNRDEVIKEVYLGYAQPAFGPIPPGYLGYNAKIEQVHTYNLDNAKKLLDQAGFKPQEGSSVLKKGTVNLEFTITTNNFPLNVRTAEILKRQWEAVGFKVNVQDLTIGELEQNYLRPREYESLLYSENIGADPDLYAFWHSSQKADPGLNFAMFGGTESDRLILEARASSDPNYRAPRYSRIQDLIADDIPALFVANSQFVYGVSNKVNGINLKNLVNQSERFLDINQWYINTRRVKM
jgi:peptide/nickel transport system substrate-binding protein